MGTGQSSLKKPEVIRVKTCGCDSSPRFHAPSTGSKRAALVRGDPRARRRDGTSFLQRRGNHYRSQWSRSPSAWSSCLSLAVVPAANTPESPPLGATLTPACLLPAHSRPPRLLPSPPTRPRRLPRHSLALTSRRLSPSATRPSSAGRRPCGCCATRSIRASHSQRPPRSTSTPSSSTRSRRSRR